MHANIGEDLLARESPVWTGNGGLGHVPVGATVRYCAWEKGDTRLVNVAFWIGVLNKPCLIHY